jgi:hypothetical protein
MKNLIYKKHIVVELYCPNCNQFLGGDGSVVFPYFCQCGNWKRDWETLDYYLTKKNERKNI